VPEVVRARKDELQVSARREPRIHPRVVRLLERGGVLPERAGREVGGVGGEGNLEPPGRAREQIEDSDGDAGTPVVVRRRHIVHRCRAVRRVPDDAVVRLDAAARPGSAHRDVAELDDVVVVDERLSRRLVDGRRDLPADLRQDHHLEVVVLELDHLPRALDGCVGIAVEAEVRVDSPRNRHGIRVRVRVGDEHLRVLADGRRGRGVDLGGTHRGKGHDERRHAHAASSSVHVAHRTADFASATRAAPDLTHT
jgi:hypothetical protein